MQLSRLQLSVLIFSLMSVSMGQSLVFAILPPLGREVNLGEVQITSIISVSALVFGLIAPLWGRYSDTRGRKPVMLIGLIGYTIGTLMFASLFQLGLMGWVGGTVLYVLALLFRSSQSVIMSATGPASAAYAADHTSLEMRTRTMAQLGTANSLGTIIGPAVSGLLATFGLLTPLFFAGLLTALAALLTFYKLPQGRVDLRKARQTRVTLRFYDPRVARYLIAAFGLFIGFSGIQQTLGFRIQDSMNLGGVETAQLTGAALMISAIFAFLAQFLLVQRLNLSPEHFIRWGLAALVVAALFVAAFFNFTVLAIGMAFMGTGLGLAMPAISASASLAVGAEEQGAIAGLVSACPAMGFVLGPLVASTVYQWHPALAAVFSGLVFVAVFAALVKMKPSV